jgi:hypothetical protein
MFDAASLGKQFVMFQRNVLPSPSRVPTTSEPLKVKPSPSYRTSKSHLASHRESHPRRMESLITVYFVYGLFNDNVSSSKYVALNDTLLSKQ